MGRVKKKVCGFVETSRRLPRHVLNTLSFFNRRYVVLGSWFNYRAKNFIILLSVINVVALLLLLWPPDHVIDGQYVLVMFIFVIGSEIADTRCTMVTLCCNLIMLFWVG